MRKLNLEEFLSRPNNRIFEYEFDKDKLKFSKLIDRIVIKCKKHGFFETCPRNLLNGCGCSKCKWENKRYTTNKIFL
jgi:hypothetical protein